MNLIEAAPEGAATTSTEGDDVRGALTAAAAELGVDINSLGWEVDKSWFRNEAGSIVPRDTVKLICWALSEEEIAAAAAAHAQRSEARPSRDRDSRDRDRDRDRDSRSRDRDRGSRDRDRGSRDRDRDSRGGSRGGSRSEPEIDPADLSEEDTAVVADTGKWMTTLLEHLEIEGEVKVVMTQSGVGVRIKCDKAGRLVGRRGRTLQAVEHLLAQSVGADHPDARFRIDVADTRPRDDDRGRDRDRGGRDRDRGGRDRDRGGRDRGERRGGRDDARNQRRLEEMARKIAERVATSGESEVVRKELNSFDRRVIHVTVAEIDGVGTRSIGEGNHKQIEIYPKGNELTDEDLSTDEVVGESVEAGTEATA